MREAATSTVSRGSDPEIPGTRMQGGHVSLGGPIRLKAFSQYCTWYSSRKSFDTVTEKETNKQTNKQTNKTTNRQTDKQKQKQKQKEKQ